MDPRARGAIHKVRIIHEDLHRMFTKVQEELKTCNSTTALADWAYALRELIRLLEDSENAAKRTSELAQKIACLVWMKSSSDGQPIRTPHCTASPKIKQAPVIPRRTKNPAEYAAFMSYFGIDEKMQEMDLVRPHWPGVVDHVTTLSEEGKPLPPGLDPSRLFPIYSLLITKKLDPCEDPE